jgi:hypothetical protein
MVFLMLLTGMSSYSAGATGAGCPGVVLLPEVGVVAADEDEPPLNFSTSSYKYKRDQSMDSLLTSEIRHATYLDDSSLWSGSLDLSQWDTSFQSDLPG